jgi:hypothetical protein
MGNSKASSVAPRTAVESPASVEFGPEQPRDFHFAVTWFTLFAHLDPIEATGPRPRVENPAPTLALVPVPAFAPLVEQRTDHESSAAWEMVVPKMIRTGQRTFLPAETVESSPKKPELL